MATSPITSINKAAAKGDPAQEAESAAPAGAGKKKRPLLIAGLLLLLAGGGGAAWYFLGHEEAPKPDGINIPLPAKPPVYAPLELFTVNLSQGGGDQYLQIGITLLLPDQAQAELIKLYMPVIRNRLLALLSSKKASELASADDKLKLAEDIKILLQKSFVPNSPPPAITSVLFTSFVIQ